MTSLILTLAIIALLYLSGPSTALSVAVNLIDDLFRGQVATITGNITLNDYEFIMTSGNVLLSVNTATNGSFNCTLPLTTGSGTVLCSNNQPVTVTASSSNWAYGYGYGYDYGYAYAPSAYSYQYGYGYSYQYDYGYVWQGTLMQYTVKWQIPSTYGNGTFTATLRVYADNTLVDSASASFNVKSLTELPRGTVGVRISEVMPNPVGDDDASKPNGEWVELQNTGTSIVNVSGWKIVDAAGTQISITGARTNTNATTISPSGFLAVYMNAAVLNNDQDAVNLYHSNGTLIDVFSYDASLFAGTDAVENYTYSPLLAIGYRFKEGYSLIITSVTSAAQCTGLFIDGQCYTVTNSSTPGESNPGMEQTFTESLALDWNLISIPVTLTNTTVQNTLSSIGGKYLIVWQYNAAAGNWSRYVPGGASNSLSDLSVENGYWVKLNATGTLNVSGAEPASTNITLVSGWNLVGYPKLTSQEVGAAVNSSIGGNYQIIWQYNAAAGNWSRYVPGGASNSLINLTAGNGYWIKMNATDTLVI
jgi:hypothetical protein